MPEIAPGDFQTIAVQRVSIDGLRLQLLKVIDQFPTVITPGFLRSNLATRGDINILRTLVLGQMTKGLEVKDSETVMKNLAQSTKNIKLGELIPHAFGDIPGAIIQSITDRGFLSIDINSALGFTWHFDQINNFNSQLNPLAVVYKDDGRISIDRELSPVSELNKLGHYITTQTLAQMTPTSFEVEGELTYAFLKNFFEHKHRVFYSSSGTFLGHNCSSGLLADIDKEYHILNMGSEYGGARIEFHLGKNTGLRWVNIEGSPVPSINTPERRYKEEVELGKQAMHLNSMIDSYYSVLR